MCVSPGEAAHSQWQETDRVAQGTHLCGRLSRSRRLAHGTGACLLQPWALLPSPPLTHLLLLLLKLLRLLRSGHLVAQVHEELHALVMRHGCQVLPLLRCELLHQ